MSEECVQNEKRDTGEDSGNTIRMGAEGIPKALRQEESQMNSVVQTKRNKKRSSPTYHMLQIASITQGSSPRWSQGNSVLILDTYSVKL